MSVKKCWNRTRGEYGKNKNWKTDEKSGSQGTAVELSYVPKGLYRVELKQF